MPSNIRPSLQGQIYIIHLFVHHGMTPKQIVEHVNIFEPGGWVTVQVVKDVLTEKGFKA